MLQQEATREDLLLEIEKLKQEIEVLSMEKNDLEVLLETTTEHSTEIENELQEKNEQVEKIMNALQREMETGRNIQADFLPGSLPTAPGWELAASFRPAREVSGDFYDAFALPGNRLGLVIADVCDKGVGAALFMSLTRSLIRVLAYQASNRLQHLAATADSYLVQMPAAKDQPAVLVPAYTYEVLNAVTAANDYIANQHSQTSMFATLFFGVLETKTGSLYYVNGGHDAPIHFSTAGIKTRLAATGPAVGMIAGAKYKVRQLELEPGDLLLTYTDGVPEARSPNGGFFSEKHLLTLIEEYATKTDLTATELLSRIATQVQAHVATAEPSDDVTMLAVRRVLPTAS